MIKHPISRRERRLLKARKNTSDKKEYSEASSFRRLLKEKETLDELKQAVEDSDKDTRLQSYREQSQP